MCNLLQGNTFYDSDSEWEWLTCPENVSPPFSTTPRVFTLSHAMSGRLGVPTNHNLGWNQPQKRVRNIIFAWIHDICRKEYYLYHIWRTLKTIWLEQCVATQSKLQGLTLLSPAAPSMWASMLPCVYRKHALQIIIN